LVFNKKVPLISGEKKSVTVSFYIFISEGLMLTSYEESLILFELHGRKSRSWLVELAGKPSTTPQTSS
jgi:hypothetical protein